MISETDRALLKERLSAGSGAIHMLGICGVGMAGLALLLKARGFDVSGCDAAPGGLKPWLEAHGIDVADGHDMSHITPNLAMVIRTSAVSSDSSEVAYGRKQGVLCCARGEVLPELIDSDSSIAVGGTHGKTTVTAMIAQILQACGKDPEFCVGGEVEALGGVAGSGAGCSVVEADESDGTVRGYRPAIAVITNIEADHLENFKSIDELKDCFCEFAGAGQTVIYCADDKIAREICSGSEHSLSYGLEPGAMLQGTVTEQSADGVVMKVSLDSDELGELRLPVPGLHNAVDALAAAAVALEQGLSFAQIAEALSAIQLPKRRWEVIAGPDGVMVVSDYAHHPTEVRALVETALSVGRSRTVAVFQPHRYSRTKALGRSFPPAFSGVDELILLPVYPASEEPLAGGQSWSLYDYFFEYRGLADASVQMPTVRLAGSRAQAWRYLRSTLSDGDLLLVIGAGDVESIAASARSAADGTKLICREQHEAEKQLLADELIGKLSDSSIRLDAPLGKRTTLGVGGDADILAEIRSRADLSVALSTARGHGAAVRIIGGGSNLLVSDLGVRGVTCRLAGEEFKSISVKNGIMRVGAAVAIATLMQYCEDNGWSGLEFLEGIPGTVGGAVRMNAGAWGSSLGEYVAWARLLDEAGEEVIVTDAVFGYRRGISEGCLVEVGLAVTEGDSGDISRRRDSVSERREWMSGLRSAGSVFLNPREDFAGRLIEQSGMKGARVGGARVLDEHANIIAVDPGATASDVIALMEKVREAVIGEFGLRLDNEIVIIG